MCLMHVQLKTEFLICHIRKHYNAKRTVALIIMHDTAFSDHTSQDVEVYELCLAPKMGCMAYE
jgi:hypothetical protein